MKNIGFIPARGGSKGVKRKNLRLLGGKTLIEHSIHSAQESQLLTDLYVTTDDAEIAAVARDCGVHVIMRPAALADDHAGMVPVIQHALNEIYTDPVHTDTLNLLQPTCPFRAAEDIDDAIVLLKKGRANAVVAVTSAVHSHPARLYINDNHYLEPLMPALAVANRQELPSYLIRSGVIYTVNIAAFNEYATFTPERSLPLLLPDNRSVNIDEEEDFAYAQFRLQAQC